jgi:hypothetical protein
LVGQSLPALQYLPVVQAMIAWAGQLLSAIFAGSTRFDSLG